MGRGQPLDTVPQDGGFGTTLHLQQKLRACFNHHDNEPLDVTVWDANWDTTLVHARVGGQYDQITFWHEDPFVLVGLNADGRLNQGRLDHTFAITEPTGLSNCPGSKCEWGATNSPRKTASWCVWNTTGPHPTKGPRRLFRRVERHALLDRGRHMGRLRDNAPILDGRLTYVGADSTDLDFETLGLRKKGVLGVAPARRRPWQQYPDYDWQAGFLDQRAACFDSRG